MTIDIHWIMIELVVIADFVDLRPNLIFELLKGYD